MLPYRIATMDRRSVPNHKPAVVIMQDVVQEGDRMHACQRFLAGKRVHPTIRCDAAHDRKMIPLKPFTKDWRQPRGAYVRTIDGSR